jgi:hypothetical protein
MQENVVTLSWPAAYGQTYRVQYKDHLEDAEWQEFIDEITAYDSVVTFDDQVAPQAQRFYQVLATP